MEQKTSATQWTFHGPTHLYRYDLENIIAKLTECAKQVIIEDNDYRYNSLDELMNKRGPNPKQLSINSREPNIVFNVRTHKRETSLQATGDDDILAPYFHIKNILISKRRKGLEFLFSGPPLFLFWVGVAYAWDWLNKKL